MKMRRSSRPDPRAGYPSGTELVEENAWLYFNFIVYPKPDFVRNCSFISTPVNRNFQQMLQVTGPTLAIKELRECCSKYSPITSSCVTLPANFTADAFVKFVQERCYSAWRNKVYIRFIGDSRSCELIGKPSDINLLVTQLNIHTTGGQFQVSSSAVTSHLSGPKEDQAIAEFETRRCKIIISVNHGSIFDCRCDVVVCPSTSHLHNQVGVGRAILDAAGSTVETECVKILRTGRLLSVSDVVHTSAGNLKSKSVSFIIHAYAPFAPINPHDTKPDLQLSKTFGNCFYLANTLPAVSSIASPAIGAGLAHFPPGRVAAAIARALEEFDDAGTTRNVRLNTIKFFDINRDVVNALRDEFKKCFTPKKYASGGATGHSSPSTLYGATDISTSSAVPRFGRQDYSDEDSSLLPPTGHTTSYTGTVADCVICLSSLLGSCHTLECGHVFHENCIKMQFKYQPRCPCCGEIYGKLQGKQLNGQKMDVSYLGASLSGYNNYGTIVIKYNIPDGKLQDGQWYKGTRRTAYLPDSLEGRRILELLRQAFNDGIVFTVGRSTTTGRDNVVTWNDIHHKTELNGPHGYPDTTYLQRVQEELAAKGYTSHETVSRQSYGNGSSSRSTTVTPTESTTLTAAEHVSTVSATTCEKMSTATLPTTGTMTTTSSSGTLATKGTAASVSMAGKPTAGIVSSTGTVSTATVTAAEHVLTVLATTSETKSTEILPTTGTRIMTSSSGTLTTKGTAAPVSMAGKPTKGTAAPVSMAGKPAAETVSSTGTVSTATVTTAVKVSTVSATTSETMSKDTVPTFGTMTTKSPPGTSTTKGTAAPVSMVGKPTAETVSSTGTVSTVTVTTAVKVSTVSATTSETMSKDTVPTTGTMTTKSHPGTSTTKGTAAPVSMVGKPTAGAVSSTGTVSTVTVTTAVKVLTVSATTSGTMSTETLPTTGSRTMASSPATQTTQGTEASKAKARKLTAGTASSTGTTSGTTLTGTSAITGTRTMASSPATQTTQGTEASKAKARKMTAGTASSTGTTSETTLTGTSAITGTRTMASTSVKSTTKGATESVFASGIDNSTS